MNKKEIENLDLTVYSKKLSNGLEVYIIPKENVKTVYATFSTKYGSVQNEFIPIGEKKMIQVPNGVAHFLEHKMFEQEDGVDPFTFFSERGADANANTSAYKTTYLFSGSDFVEENINYLLNYVQSPYFTDKNVEKEKGIIEQEIKMYEDDPYSVLYEKTLYNSFTKHPIRESVIGTVESINSITKEILYKCYNTFYNPSNMFMVITGNVNPDDIIKVIEKNQDEKTFEKSSEIKVKSYSEEDKVYKEKEIIKMNVSIPKMTINFKFDLESLGNISKIKKLFYLSIIFDVNFGSVSLFNESLKKMEVTNTDLEISTMKSDTHILYTIFLETQYLEKAINLVMNETKKLEITEEELERSKKNIISSYLFGSDNVFNINERVMQNIISYDKVIYDICDIIRSLNIKEAKTILKNMSFDNNSIVIIDKK
ncbi:MAG: insulinase family protein [Clostridium sp.]|nr:insulinase family protein [Clostridium sp.]MCM1444343.1 insulinase family protein [Candidatus Amulumruptor caecigallinarius]